MSDDGRRLYVELRNGNFGIIDLTDPTEYAPGEVLLVPDDPERQPRLERVPSDSWGNDPWIGIVRLKLDDISIIDSGGRLHRLPTTAVPYAVGNTVEVGEFAGVIRVLDENPVRLIDLPTVGETAIERFRGSPTDARWTFEDFGGLTAVVSRAQELVELPLRKRAELRALGARPIKGVLFTGQPGTGKTMLARIIAAKAGATLYEIRGPEIFSKWYGQTGELLRAIFDDAAANESSIIFIDEIDSVAPRRGEESHEETKRVVAQLLTLMDGFEPETNVVVIATTNRPDDIDPALRRPGRFDWEIHFPMPDLEDRVAILIASARHLVKDEPLSHGIIAAKTDGWSAADLAAIWGEAAILTVDDDRSSISMEDYAGGFERVQRQRVAKDIQLPARRLE